MRKKEPIHEHYFSYKNLVIYNELPFLFYYFFVILLKNEDSKPLILNDFNFLLVY